MKVIIIMVDGMRPDALDRVVLAQPIIEVGASTMCERTVMPSVTLPCHMSMFHSVEPTRHGTTTNTYMPQVRPINGLFEVLNKHDKKCAMFYSWEQLRDVARPGILDMSFFIKGEGNDFAKVNDNLTELALQYIQNENPDFVFLYLGHTDDAGHRYGWMSPEYMDAIENSWKNICRVLDNVDDDFCVLITADHGGHDRTHGTDMEEDMLVPMIAVGQAFEPERDLGPISIIDIAPTVAELFGIAPDKEWEGKSFL